MGSKALEGQHFVAEVVYCIIRFDFFDSDSRPNLDRLDPY